MKHDLHQPGKSELGRNENPAGASVLAITAPAKPDIIYINADDTGVLEAQGLKDNTRRV